MLQPFSSRVTSEENTAHFKNSAHYNTMKFFKVSVATECIYVYYILLFRHWNTITHCYYDKEKVLECQQAECIAQKVFFCEVQEPCKRVCSLTKRKEETDIYFLLSIFKLLFLCLVILQEVSEYYMQMNVF